MNILSISMIDPSLTAEPPSQEAIARMDELIAEFKSEGVLIETGGRWPGMLQLKVARKDGTTTVTDGPFTESKEVVGGFALLNVKDREQAIALTNRFLDLVGVGNATCFLHEVQMG